MTPEYVTVQGENTLQRAGAELKKAIRTKGKEWLVAAIVDGSIGYYSPHAAGIHIESILRGDHQYNERIASCFKGDVAQEVKFDIGYFARREALSPAYARACILRCNGMAQVTDFAANGGFSMAYPTKHVAADDAPATPVEGIPQK